MKTVGIKLADGSFYPIMEDGNPQQIKLDLTTAHNNQTCVMVDLYRSAECSMEDAEYIDTLKIENLVAHPNGEPNLSFSVGIDENGELSAQIEDPETGLKSNPSITRINRTIEERLITDDYTIETSTDEIKETADSENGSKAGVIAGVAAGAGLLAMAAALNKKNKSDDEIAEEVAAIESIVVDTYEDVPVVDESGLDLDLSDMDFGNDETIADETLVEETSISDENDFSLDDMPDFGSDETIANDDLNLDDMPDFSSDETIANDDLNLDDMPDFSSDETITNDDLNLDDMPDFSSDETIANDDLNLDDMPDFSSDETIANDDLNLDDMPDFSSDETIANDDLNLDDMDFGEETTPADTDLDFSDIPDFGESDSLSESTDLDDDLDLGPMPVFGGEDFSAQNNFASGLDDDLFADDNDSEPMAQSGGLSFTGLYDKETEMGDSSVNVEDDLKKKTKAPVIICIICALICLIATALLLFVIPSKYNLLSKKNMKNNTVVVEKTVETEKTTVEKPETVLPKVEEKPSVPVAVEDTVIVIEEAEEVIPLPPPVKNIEEKPKDITYKIKWGDTLWDIADTYYKNPWRYKKIASYNKIKNPDYIISGTTILIPAE